MAKVLRNDTRMILKYHSKKALKFLYIFLLLPKVRRATEELNNEIIGYRNFSKETLQKRHDAPKKLKFFSNIDRFK